MTTFTFPSIFVFLVGLVFSAIAMAFLFLYVKKTRLLRYEGTQSHPFFSTSTC